MGTRNKTLLWIKSYLENRVQRTISNNIFSELDTIKCGVPQGSILGPLFFLVYINDLKNILIDCKYQIYAEDTVIYCIGSSFNEVNVKLQNVLDKVMSFGSRNKIKKSGINIIKVNDEILGNVPTYKYLGIHLDQLLNFEHHTDKLLI